MDSFNIVVEKRNAIKKHQQLAHLFRLLEICFIGLVIISSSFSIRFSVLGNSSKYIKDLATLLLSPTFVFFLGNTIVITLFAISGRFSCESTSDSKARTDFEGELYHKEEEIDGSSSSCESKNNDSENGSSSSSDCDHPVASSSSAEEKHGTSADPSKESRESSYDEDDMSNEEFRCVVEGFIARQKTFRTNEEKSELLLKHYNHCT